MISWIQRYFQHHFRFVFLLVLLAMAIPLVMVYNQSSGVGRADRKISDRSFFGHNLASEREMAVIGRETQLSGILHQENANPMFRLSALAIADQLHLPGPTENEFKEFLKTLPAFAGENGQFDPVVYNRFQTEVRKSNQFPESVVRHVLEDDFRINRVTALLGGPGYVQPQEVKNQLERFESTWTLGIATVDFKSFAPTITPTDLDLTRFFEQNSARYEIPPQVSVRYAEFPATAYIDQVKATEAEIKAFYDANPARFAKPDDKASEKKTAAPAGFNDPAVRLQVELTFKIERAAQLATKAASDFTFELYEKKIVPGTPAFDALLASRQLSLKTLAPFSHDNPPAELGGSPDVANEAFKLGKDRLYSDAIALRIGSVVLFWQDTIPARQPSLAEVKSQVSADYIENEKRKRFVDLGKTLRAQLEARLKTGDSFDKAVAAVSSSTAAKLEGKMLAPFTLRQRPQDLDYLVFSTLESLKKGDVSDMVIGPDKGLIVYAADKKEPDLSDANPQYKAFQSQIARVTAARNSAEYLAELSQAEMARNSPATP